MKTTEKSVSEGDGYDTAMVGAAQADVPGDPERLKTLGADSSLEACVAGVSDPLRRRAFAAQRHAVSELSYTVGLTVSLLRNKTASNLRSRIYDC
jgi:hypothetical protein